MTINHPPAPARVVLGYDDNQYHIEDAFGETWCDDYNQEFGSGEPADLVLTTENMCEYCLEAMVDEGLVETP